MRDRIFCFILIIILLPLILCIALISLCIFKTGVLCHLERLGLHRKKFMICKFRSMQNWSPERINNFLTRHPAMQKQWEEQRKLNPDPRCPKWGLFLRRFSLDELPQLFNVLQGDMALVGPRPIVAEEECRYGKYSELLHSVKPGITGLWQVSGRNELTYHRRIAINLYYVRHRSLRLDLWILYRTVWAVIGGRGAY